MSRFSLVHNLARNSRCCGQLWCARFASIGLGAVIVGETRRIDLGAKAAPGIDAMKAQYKRPATIPFPKQNPYHAGKKAALGKKLYFDTRCR